MNKYNQIFDDKNNPFSKDVIKLAIEFDKATLENDIVKIEELIKEAQIQLTAENEASQAYLFYSLGTVYSDVSKLKGISDEKSLKKQIYYYRKSLKILGKEKFFDQRYSPYILGLKEILITNYANSLFECGRIIAAIEQYKTVLALHNGFGMALGNLGRVYQHYAMLEYDETHRDILHSAAYKCFTHALVCNDPNTHQNARMLFQSRIDQYDSDYVERVLKPEWKFPEFSYDNPDEYAYRKWCLNRGLFLNTLNDLTIDSSSFMADVIQLPEMITDINSKPIFHGMYSQLKQEYIYARYLFYCAQHPYDKPHYADKNTYIVAYTDYTQYSIRLEKVKTALKTLFGLFDKIAFFLNSYFDLEINEYDISFRSVWQKEAGHGKKKYHYKNTLNPKKNYALSSLCWISKDFYETFEDSPNPELKRIKEIRNALEHKYVKIYDTFTEPDIEKMGDGLALYISENELFEVTMQLIKILRESIISLSLCVNIAEKQKKDENKNKLIYPMPLWTYEDDWKV